MDREVCEHGILVEAVCVECAREPVSLIKTNKLEAENTSLRKELFDAREQAKVQETKYLNLINKMNKSLKHLNNQLQEMRDTACEKNKENTKLRKHDCERLINEAQGCAVCSKLGLDLVKAKKLQDYINWKIQSLDAQLKVKDKKIAEQQEIIEKLHSNCKEGSECVKASALCQCGREIKVVSSCIHHNG